MWDLISHPRMGLTWVIHPSQMPSKMGHVPSTKNKLSMSTTHHPLTVTPPGSPLFLSYTSLLNTSPSQPITWFTQHNTINPYPHPTSSSLTISLLLLARRFSATARFQPPVQSSPLLSIPSQTGIDGGPLIHLDAPFPTTQYPHNNILSFYSFSQNLRKLFHPYIISLYYNSSQYSRHSLLFYSFSQNPTILLHPHIIFPHYNNTPQYSHHILKFLLHNMSDQDADLELPSDSPHSTNDSQDEGSVATTLQSSHTKLADQLPGLLDESRVVDNGAPTGPAITTMPFLDAHRNPVDLESFKSRQLETFQQLTDNGIITTDGEVGQILTKLISRVAQPIPSSELLGPFQEYFSLPWHHSLPEHNELRLLALNLVRKRLQENHQLLTELVTRARAMETKTLKEITNLHQEIHNIEEQLRTLPSEVSLNTVLKGRAQAHKKTTAQDQLNQVNSLTSASEKHQLDINRLHETQDLITRFNQALNSQLEIINQLEQPLRTQFQAIRNEMKMRTQKPNPHQVNLPGNSSQATVTSCPSTWTLAKADQHRNKTDLPYDEPLKLPLLQRALLGHLPESKRRHFVQFLDQAQDEGKCAQIPPDQAPVDDSAAIDITPVPAKFIIYGMCNKHGRSIFDDDEGNDSYITPTEFGLFIRSMQSNWSLSTATGDNTYTVSTPAPSQDYESIPSMTLTASEMTPLLWHHLQLRVICLEGIYMGIKGTRNPDFSQSLPRHVWLGLTSFNRVHKKNPRDYPLRIEQFLLAKHQIKCIISTNRMSTNWYDSLCRTSTGLEAYYHTPADLQRHYNIKSPWKLPVRITKLTNISDEDITGQHQGEYKLTLLKAGASYPLAAIRSLLETHGCNSTSDPIRGSDIYNIGTYTLSWDDRATMARASRLLHNKHIKGYNTKLQIEGHRPPPRNNQCARCRKHGHTAKDCRSIQCKTCHLPGGHKPTEHCYLVDPATEQSNLPPPLPSPMATPSPSTVGIKRTATGALDLASAFASQKRHREAITQSQAGARTPRSTNRTLISSPMYVWGDETPHRRTMRNSSLDTAASAATSSMSAQQSSPQASSSSDTGHRSAGHGRRELQYGKNP